MSYSKEQKNIFSFAVRNSLVELENNSSIAKNLQIWIFLTMFFFKDVFIGSKNNISILNYDKLFKGDKTNKIAKYTL